MIVLICGGRRYTDGPFLFTTLDRLHAEHGFTLLVEGGQRTYDPRTRKAVGGADLFAHDWAVLNGVEVHTEYARWGDLSNPDARIKTSPSGKRYDANAGARRNQKMLDDRPIGLVVAFSPSGAGTADMVRRALAAGVQVLEFRAP
jgi:hypothetical protein